MINCLTLSSLAKVFPDAEPDRRFFLSSATMLRNDVYSFQIAYRGCDYYQKRIEVTCPDTLGGRVSVRQIDYVPCDLPIPPGCEALCDRSAPGLFPDILRPLPKIMFAYGFTYRSLLVTVDCSNMPAESDIYTVTVCIDDGEKCDVSFELTVLDAFLPKQSIPVTNWLHCDCLCNFYSVPFGSDEFRRILKNFVETAVKNGINMILTPLFTPPLDTMPGGERLNVQLLDIRLDENGKYTFSFDRLISFIGDIVDSGAEYFEFSHLFTQWGCKYAPNIYAETPDGYRKIFGWETDGCSDEYRSFLAQLLPELTGILKKHSLYERCFFHISDEPAAAMIDRYAACSLFVQQYVDKDRIIDAISDTDYYTRGLIAHPVASLNAIHRFTDIGAEGLWGYYCCCELRTPNRFLALRAARNRILGALLFRYDVRGFLQWGYNFYNTNLSVEAVDPYATSTAGGWIPGGDAYVVYPDSNGTALESLRLVVFADALRDYRALCGALEFTKREELTALLGINDITFVDFPDDPVSVLRLREKLNTLLAQHGTNCHR